MRRIVSAVISTFVLSLFCLPLTAQSTLPTFLYFLEGKGVPTGTIHAFSVNTSTGMLTETPGSPFNAGLVPKQLVVDPTRKFLYAVNDQSQDITGFSIDPSTGALTELPGSPYLIGAEPVIAAVNPNGRFLYVFAIGFVINTEEELLYIYAVDPVTGFLTLTASSPTPWEFDRGLLITSMGFNAAGDYAYLGQASGGNKGAPTLICAIDFTSGALSFIGSVQPGRNGEADKVAVVPSGNFMYSINTTFSQADAFAVAPDGSNLVEIPGSPYALPYGPNSLAVHPSGNFLYVTNSNTSFQAPSTGPTNGSIYAFSVNSATGGLTQVPGSPFQTGIDPLSIAVDPSGSLAYWTNSSTSSSFAQIFGASINPASGALTPFSVIPFSDSTRSTGAQLLVLQGPAPVINPVPTISSLSPSSMIASDVAFTLQINGTNFVPGSAVYFDGQFRETTFVSSTQLTASIIASDVADDGTSLVFVANPPPGGGVSASINFPKPALAPVIAALSQSSVPAGGLPFALFVSGNNFVASSFVNFNGTPIPTTVFSPTLLLAIILTREIVQPGTESISVTTLPNGIPGGGTSNILTLTIVTPILPLTISGILPSSATAGGPAFSLTVNGTGFQRRSQVSFNLINVPTTFISTTQLVAQIPASAIAISGNPYVIVTNPAGVTSSFLTFTINNPPPVGEVVTPQTVPAGSNKFTLNVSGSGFTPASIVLISGSARATNFLSSTQLQATLLPDDLAHSGTLDLVVMNPPPGGGTAAAIALPVSDYSMTPLAAAASVVAGQTARFDLTVSPINGAFSNPVTLSISGLPAGTVATIAPSPTVTLGATNEVVTISIATMAHASTSALNFPHGNQTLLLLLSAVGIALGLVVATSGRRMPRFAPQLLLATLLVVCAGLMACAGAGVATPSTSGANNALGTPSGNYPIIIKATSGSVARSVTVTLTVM